MLSWVLWLTVVFGGGFLGAGSAWTLATGSGGLALGLNAFIYLGCAAYALPKLLGLVRRA